MHWSGELPAAGPAPGAPTAAALGFFDGVHLGHAAVIGAAAAKSAAGLRTAVVTFDRHPDTGRPAPEITCRALKEEILASLGVELVVYLDFQKVRNLPPEEFLERLCRKLNVKYISCGFNYRFGKGASAGLPELRAYCGSRGVEAGEVRPVCVDGAPVSSTRIRTLLQAGDAAAARRMLGRPFALLAEVVHGRALGRTLGIPTINQQPAAPQLLPRFGVYASRVLLDGELWPSVTSVGVKPTVSSDSAPLSETYIPGFSGDLYGRTLRVDFLRFLRPEQKFPGLAELTAQMQSDTRQALRVARCERESESIRSV